jgi:cytochrome c oxidase assembly protein Cox11
LCISLAHCQAEVKEHEKEALHSHVAIVMEVLIRIAIAPSSLSLPLQRIICQVEGISLTTSVGQVSDLTTDHVSEKNGKKLEETRKAIARGLLS